VRWDDNHLCWRHYLSFCHLWVVLWTIRAAIYQWQCVRDVLSVCVSRRSTNCVVIYQWVSELSVLPSISVHTNYLISYPSKGVQRTLLKLLGTVQSTHFVSCYCIERCIIHTYYELWPQVMTEGKVFWDGAKSETVRNEERNMIGWLCTGREEWWTGLKSYGSLGVFSTA
jgi:hypothetical protein